MVAFTYLFQHFGKMGFLSRQMRPGNGHRILDNFKVDKTLKKYIMIDIDEFD